MLAELEGYEDEATLYNIIQLEQTKIRGSMSKHTSEVGESRAIVRRHVLCEPTRSEATSVDQLTAAAYIDMPCHIS